MLRWLPARNANISTNEIDISNNVRNGGGHEVTGPCSVGPRYVKVHVRHVSVSGKLSPMIDAHENNTNQSRLSSHSQGYPAHPC